MKTDAGDVHQVQVPSTAQLKRIEPGQTDLTKAETIDFSGLAVGDRVLVTLDPNATGGTPQAARVIAIKQADVTKMQQAESEAWSAGRAWTGEECRRRGGRHRGEHAGRRGDERCDGEYDAGDDAQALCAGLGELRAGAAGADQRNSARRSDLSARGTKSADGTSIAAQGVVSGSFRSIPGNGDRGRRGRFDVTVKDLVDQKAGHVHVSADAQLRRLDDSMATMLATRRRLEGGQVRAGALAVMGSKWRRGANGGGGSGQRSFSQGGGGQGGGGDLESILERAPNDSTGAPARKAKP